MSEPRTESYEQALLRRHENRPNRIGYAGYLFACFQLALMIILRRQRLLVAALITLLPVVIPAMTAYFSQSEFAAQGNDIFVYMMKFMTINVLVPLLARFCATRQVGEDVESNTLVYMLTRPTPRSAWVLGRYLAYFAVTSLLVLVSIFLSFIACTALPGISLNLPDLLLMGRFMGVALLAVMAYGAFALFLGAATKRPIVYGVLFVYGWQGLAFVIPGVIDFLTIQKYTDALLPKLAAQAGAEMTAELANIQKQAFAVEGVPALVTLFAMTAVFLAWSIYTVRTREYAASRAIGS